MIEYRLIRSKRRTLSIVIDGEGALVVRAPMRMPVREMEAFIAQKERWICEKQALAAQRERFVLEDGARMPFAGGFLRLRLCDGQKAEECGGELFLPREKALEAARAWRKARAAELLGPRIAQWSGVTGLVPLSVAYTQARKRWGSMSSRGALRLNAALVHCPANCWDYVIVHELCHMAQPNHSPAFHALVRSFLPEADEIRSRMKQMGHWAGLLS